MTAGPLTIRTCIACGAMESPAPCTGACDDRRLELPDGEGHDDALAALERARDRLAPLTGFAGGILGASAPPADVAAVQRAARDALREAAAAPQADPEPARRVTAWWCAGCGRIEAPQPCLGVCVRRPVDYVRADEHDRVPADTTEVRRAGDALTAIAPFCVPCASACDDARYPALRSRETRELDVSDGGVRAGRGVRPDVHRAPRRPPYMRTCVRG